MASALASSRRRRPRRASHFEGAAVAADVPVERVNAEDLFPPVRPPAAHGCWTEGAPPELTRPAASLRTRETARGPVRRVQLSTGKMRIVREMTKSKSYSL